MSNQLSFIAVDKSRDPEIISISVTPHPDNANKHVVSVNMKAKPNAWSYGSGVDTASYVLEGDIHLRHDNGTGEIAYVSGALAAREQPKAWRSHIDFDKRNDPSILQMSIRKGDSDATRLLCITRQNQAHWYMIKDGSYRATYSLDMTADNPTVQFVAITAELSMRPDL